MTAYDDGRVSVHLGDCLDVLRSLPDASVDAVVTDPPYGLEFMGKEWDKFDRKGPASFENLGQPLGATKGDGTQRGGRSPLEDKPRFSTMGPLAMRQFGAWCELWATECLRVLKPGGYMLAFGGTRTWHRLACAVEDAGFEVRDSIAWLYGSGFPKSLDVSKAIDKAAGATREVVGRTVTPFRVDNAANRGTSLAGSVNGDFSKQTENGYRYTEHTAPATPDAERWQGWGTALKPAFEPVVVARKPLQGTVAANVLAHGTGALNIDGCRVGTDGGTFKASKPEGTSNGIYGHGINGTVEIGALNAGRWPANVVLDESQAAALDEMSGEQRDGTAVRHNGVKAGMYGPDLAPGSEDLGYGGSGGASRFFYVAKAPKRERPRVNGTAHPTVKPLDLMRWLVRLVTPPGGTVLEPFAGSGTTVEACIVEGFHCIAIERGEEYLPLILQRIHRRRDPVAAIRQTGDDLGLFELDGESA